MVATKEKKTAKVKATGVKPKLSKAKKTVRKTKRVSAEIRYQMVAEAAYYLAEASSFDPAKNMDNWLKAEAQIAKEFKSGK